MPRFDKFTTPLQSALAEAQSKAVGLDNQFIEPLHLMQALLEQEGGTARHLLAQAGINIQQLQNRLDAALERLPKVQGGQRRIAHIQ